MTIVRRIRRALGRGLARADTWVAAAALVLAGGQGAEGHWGWAIAAGVVGLVFLVSSGDYCWRRGYVTGRREAGSPGVR